MRVLDLFSGIGGFSLGFEWASPEFETVAFCEIDKYAQKVLKKHWPEVPIKCLGNAIVPQIAELIGKRIMEVEHDEPR